MQLGNSSESGYSNPGPGALTLSGESGDFFSGLFENRASKIAVVTFSIVGSYVSIAMLYSIVWYQKFGSDGKRTLINRLFVYFWFCPLAWEATVQQVDIIRYIFGPLPKAICKVSYFGKVSEMHLSFIIIKPQNNLFLLTRLHGSKLHRSNILTIGTSEKNHFLSVTSTSTLRSVRYFPKIVGN